MIVKYTFSFNVCVQSLEYIQFGLWKDMETLNPSQDIQKWKKTQRHYGLFDNLKREKLEIIPFISKVGKIILIKSKGYVSEAHLLQP
jgi:hypothetical protein